MRALGANQRGMIRGMQARELKGWYLGCGWIWENASTSEKLCQSLLKRGLVAVSYPHGVNAFYQLTDAGLAVKV